MSRRGDNQEVGLEAAFLQRVRNSSLVEWGCADNGPGLKPTTEAADFVHEHGVVGERSSCIGVVSEGTVECGEERMPA